MKNRDNVYSDDDCHVLFAASVKRVFGENKIVRLNNGNEFLASVLPLMTGTPEDFGLKVVGSIAT